MLIDEDISCLATSQRPSFFIKILKEMLVECSAFDSLLLAPYLNTRDV